MKQTEFFFLSQIMLLIFFFFFFSFASHCHHCVCVCLDVVVCVLCMHMLQRSQLTHYSLLEYAQHNKIIQLIFLSIIKFAKCKILINQLKPNVHIHSLNRDEMQRLRIRNWWHYLFLFFWSIQLKPHIHEKRGKKRIANRCIVPTQHCCNPLMECSGFIF